MALDVRPGDPGEVEVRARFPVPPTARVLDFRWEWTSTGTAVAPGLDGRLTGIGALDRRVDLDPGDPRFRWVIPPRPVPLWSWLLLAVGSLTLAAVVLGRLRRGRAPPAGPPPA